MGPTFCGREASVSETKTGRVIRIAGAPSAGHHVQKRKFRPASTAAAFWSVGRGQIPPLKVIGFLGRISFQISLVAGAGFCQALL